MGFNEAFCRAEVSRSDRDLSINSPQNLSMNSAKLFIALGFWLCFFVGGCLAWGQVTITLSPSVGSPQFLGTVVTFTATVNNPVLGHTYDYQFNANLQGAGASIARDFNLSNSFTWTSIQHEGVYVVSVVVRDTTSQPYTVYSPVGIGYYYAPRVSTTTTTGAVNSTGHPLVALFSGPGCPTGDYIRVRFGLNAGQSTSLTNAMPCSSYTSNFYVAGMLPNSNYLMNFEELNSSGGLLQSGPQLPFATGSIPSTITFPTFTTVVPPPPSSQAFPVILHGFLSTATEHYPVTATDLAGNVIWYSPVPAAIFGHSETGGNMIGVQINGRDPHLQVMHEFDLAGNILHETNASILNEQLSALGIKLGKTPIQITTLHHEGRRFGPTGNIIVFGARDKSFTNAQGGTKDHPVDVIGDVYMVLNPNMQLIWYWDAFEHEDINRLATLNDTCAQGQPGCPYFDQSFQVANDWLHSNSAQFTADGNIIVSQRSQDFVLKLNYANGNGDGTILWAMGNGGNFALVNPIQTTCQYPGLVQWFTHQHDAEFQFNDATFGALQIFTVFDDGNTRQVKCDPNATSRGMLFYVNEALRAVYMVPTAMGTYSAALGSGQTLYYGSTFHTSYDSGFINAFGNGQASQTVESDSLGNVVYDLQANTASTYRTFRMPDLYSPPEQ